jgi:hypothetical protein
MSSAAWSGRGLPLLTPLGGEVFGFLLGAAACGSIEAWAETVGRRPLRLGMAEALGRDWGAGVSRIEIGLFPKAQPRVILRFTFDHFDLGRGGHVESWMSPRDSVCARETCVQPRISPVRGGL